MKHHDQVADAFGSTAAAYLTSTVHATGADLQALADAVRATPDATVLDLGCGAGHASFAVAPHAREVVAYDLAPQMLATVDAAARERGFANIRTCRGPAERLPFDAATFDWVVSRMSAHHWHDVPAALAEARRVLKPGGRVLMVDIAGPDHPLLDTYLQALEVLRDASHVRNYRADEWLAMFRGAGFDAQVTSRWRLPIEFDSWVARMRTPAGSVTGIRALWAHAPDEVRSHYAVQPDGSFEHDALLIDAR
ncbi:SAM-dependent methyltransferase [Burkholderia ubonensis]|uniref:class I SAM-dependent methyltransferase n=1 Tax=Burkholderia ubonensis TaxID=101571 RepID=UPI00075E89C7|nr:methyltransferase domain-containing protein [Burkholderia ubonensis]KWI45551.1 SAM-dependent methyltransferase [Burkholderia ubonensis]